MPKLGTLTSPHFHIHYTFFNFNKRYFPSCTFLAHVLYLFRPIKMYYTFFNFSKRYYFGQRFVPPIKIYYTFFNFRKRYFSFCTFLVNVLCLFRPIKMYYFFQSGNFAMDPPLLKIPPWKPPLKAAKKFLLKEIYFSEIEKRRISFSEIEKKVHFDWSKKVQNWKSIIKK